MQLAERECLQCELCCMQLFRFYSNLRMLQSFSFPWPTWEKSEHIEYHFGILIVYHLLFYLICDSIGTNKYGIIYSMGHILVFSQNVIMYNQFNMQHVCVWHSVWIWEQLVWLLHLDPMQSASRCVRYLTFIQVNDFHPSDCTKWILEKYHTHTLLPACNK